MIEGCDDALRILQDLSASGRDLCSSAEAAEASLLDEVAKKHIARVKALGEYVQKKTRLGEECVRRLRFRLKTLNTYD